MNVSIRRGSWEANRLSDAQEISNLSWKLSLPDHIYNNTPLHPVLTHFESSSHLSSAFIFVPISFIIKALSVLRQVRNLFHSEFPTKYCVVLPFFNFQYPVFSLKSSSSCLLLLPYLTVTSVLPSNFSSITWIRRQFLRKIWPIQFTFLPFIVCRIFMSSLTLCNTYSFLEQSVQTFFSNLLQHHIVNLSRYFWSTVRSVQILFPYQAGSKCSTLLSSTLIYIYIYIVCLE